MSTSRLDYIDIPDAALVQEYLLLLKWHHAQNSSWNVFVSPEDEEIELVFPVSGIEWEKRTYAKNGIQALAAILDEPISETAQRIQYLDRDLLRIRITDRAELPLYDAAQEVSNLELLIRDAAANEYRPRPHYTSRPKRATEVTHSFRFGHTFQGSFGFTIASGKINRPPQRSLFEGTGEVVTISPFSRRIVERIFRGLVEVSRDDTTEERLAAEYASGYNANMLKSLLRITSKMRTEFNVIWSPRLPAADDLGNIDPICIGPEYSPLLQSTWDVLQQMEPVEVRITGSIIGLSSENPLDEDGQHQITVKAHHEGREIRVHVAVNQENYQLATEIHRLGGVVEVTGQLSRSGTFYRLRGPRDFQVWSPGEDIY